MEDKKNGKKGKKKRVMFAPEELGQPFDNSLSQDSQDDDYFPTINEPQESNREDAPEQQQDEAVMYVRQTWDLNRFNKSMLNQQQLDQTQEEVTIFQADSFDLSMMNPDSDTLSLSTLKRSWREFNEFYLAFIKDLDYFHGASPKSSSSYVSPEVQQVRSTLQKYNYQLIEVPAISLNLLNIVKVLREEEKDEPRYMIDGN